MLSILPQNITAKLYWLPKCANLDHFRSKWSVSPIIPSRTYERRRRKMRYPLFNNLTLRLRWLCGWRVLVCGTRHPWLVSGPLDGVSLGRSPLNHLTKIFESCGRLSFRNTWLRWLVTSAFRKYVVNFTSISVAIQRAVVVVVTVVAVVVAIADVVVVVAVVVFREVLALLRWLQPQHC